MNDQRKTKGPLWDPRWTVVESRISPTRYREAHSWRPTVSAPCPRFFPVGLQRQGRSHWNEREGYCTRANGAVSRRRGAHFSFNSGTMIKVFKTRKFCPFVTPQWQFRSIKHTESHDDAPSTAAWLTCRCRVNSWVINPFVLESHQNGLSLPLWTEFNHPTGVFSHLRPC